MNLPYTMGESTIYIYISRRQRYTRIPGQRQKQLQKWAAWFKELGHLLESAGMVVKGNQKIDREVDNAREEGSGDIKKAVRHHGSR